MNRMLASALLGAAGLLLVSACSSGGGYSQSFSQIAPAGSATAGALPPFRVGPLTQDFATPLPRSTAQDAVLSDFRIAMLYWSRSDYAWRVIPGTTSHVVGRALLQLEVAARSLKTSGVVLGGTDRFFKTQVAGPSGATAVVVTCDNTTKDVVVVMRATGQFHPYGVHASHLYILETYHLVPRAGHWAIASLAIATLPDPRARQCQP